MGTIVNVRSVESKVYMRLCKDILPNRTVRMQRAQLISVISEEY